GGRARSLVQHDDRLHALGPLRVGYADDGALGDGWVLGYAPLDLGRVDVLGGRLDHAGGRPDECDGPVGLAAAKVAGVVPAAALAAGVLLGPVPVAVHHGRPAGDDLARLADGELVVVGIDDPHLDDGGRAAVRADGRVRERVERQHAHDLGLPVTAGMPGPRARVDRDHLVPLRFPAEGAQALQVVPAVLVGFEDLLAGR